MYVNTGVQVYMLGTTRCIIRHRVHTDVSEVDSIFFNHELKYNNRLYA